MDYVISGKIALALGLRGGSLLPPSEKSSCSMVKNARS